MISKALLGAACAAVIMATAGVSSAHAATARQFLESAIRGDDSEIMLGRIAERRADSPSVRAFGRVLFEDHSKAKAQAAALAGQMGMTVPEQPLHMAMVERERLAPLSGELFDREFVRYMVRDHREDIAEFRKEIARQDGVVSRLARKQLPVIEKHLDMASALYREPKVAEVMTR